VIDTGIRGAAVFDLSKKPVGGRRLRVKAPQAPREVVSSPSGVRGRAGRKRIFSIFQSHRGPPAERKMHIFCPTSSVRQPHIDILNDPNIMFYYAKLAVDLWHVQWLVQAVCHAE